MMRNFKTLVMAIGAFLIANGAIAQDNNQTDKNYEILLPAEQHDYTVEELTVDKHPNRAEWMDFFDENGRWMVDFDEATKTPHRAFGKAIHIDGYDKITEDNVEEASMKFLRKYSSLMGIDTDNLRLMRKTYVNKRWYVTYKQMHEGLEVLLSEIELRIFENGNVMAFGADYYNDIDVSTVPTITQDKAIAAARDGLQYNPKSDKTLANPKQYILPVERGDEVEYKLVYKINVNQPRKMRKLETYVNAHTGDIVRRKNAVVKATEKLSATGGVKEMYSFDKETELPFRHMKVDVNGEELVTNENGELEFDMNGSATVSAKMEGLYAKVHTDDIDADYSAVFEEGDELKLEWNDENSSKYERYLYYHTNIAHDFAKSIDPEMTCMDFPMDVEIQFEGQMPNASSQGDKITFYAVSNKQYYFAETPSILYHEYGHSINILLYQDLGVESQYGMENMTCQEGMADIYSGLIIDSPKIGIGAFAEDSAKIIRNLKNDIIYPDSLQGDGHYNGLILGGAYWDLREMTDDLEYVRHLTHFVKYGLPDDINIGVAFGEFFLETLIADDDDGDLSNGTPHSDEIIACFNRHKIGLNLFYSLSFAHTQLEDTRDTDNPYPVVFNIDETAGIMDSRIEDVAVVYTLNSDETVYRVDATRTGDNEFTASIPAQPRGTMVKYHMVGTESVSGEEIDFYENVKSKVPYVFLVGFEELYVDNFDDKGGSWDTSYEGAGMLTCGEFEIAAPKKVDLSMFGMDQVIQPGEDHSPEGEKCLVTDGESGGGMQFPQHSLMGGLTAAESESMDMSNYQDVVVKYFEYSNFLAINAKPEEPMYIKVQVSPDGGESWATIDSLGKCTRQWLMKLHFVPQEYLTSDFKLRFAACNLNSAVMGGMVLAEVLIDDLKILTASPVSSVDENDISSGMSVFPNPVENSTTLRFDVGSGGYTAIRIYNQLGSEVATISEGYLGGGTHTAIWNARNSLGEKVAPGVYYVKLINKNNVITERIIIK
jgi:hypothetical protein